MLVFTLLLLIGSEAEGTLQAWHRKDCPLVQDLNFPLSKLVAQHFDLSDHYCWNAAPNNGVSHLHILLRKLAFRNKTNEQAVAVMKFLDRGGARQYFFVLLENCGVVEPTKKGVKKRFFFGVNTQFPSLEHLYPSLRAAKHGAALFEKSGRWLAPQNSNAREVSAKTNIPKRLIQGVGWSLYLAFSPVTIPFTGLACILWASNGFPTDPAKYCTFAPHWESLRSQWSKGPYGMSQLELHKSYKYEIGLTVYVGKNMIVSKDVEMVEILKNEVV